MSPTDARSVPPTEQHPRPQLTRPRWTDLCGEWGFAHDDADAGQRERWQERTDVFDRTIVVPFPPESPASGIADPGYHPVVWYRRTFSPADAGLQPGERLLLHLGAVDHRARVWVDGRLVAEHEGGHTPITADVTDALDPAVPDDGHVLVVRAEDPPLDVTQPRGKQDWLERPHAIWYERTTGIWQPVWLEPVPALRVAGIRWASDLDRAALRVRVSLALPQLPPAATRRLLDGVRVHVRLTLRGEVVADDTWSPSGPVLQRDVALDGFRMSHHAETYLWSPEHPNLVEAEVTLVDGHDTVVDGVRSYTGLRSVAAGDGRFLLNGRAYPLRMVLAQNYWPQSHLAAPDPDALRREVELAKELGFNGVRIHQKIEDPRFLHWCDRLGLLAWGELPSPLDFDPQTVTRMATEWLEVLERDASSPALMAWVPFNESWGVPNLERDEAQRSAVRALFHLTKAVDPTRLVIGNDGWEHLVSDVLAVHDYSRSGDLLRERYGSYEAFETTVARVRPYYRALTLPELVRGEQPVMVTECGGVTLDPVNPDFWNGYGAADTAEELLERYRDVVVALMESPVVAGFCWTQLADTGQERNGLVTQQRRHKLDPAAVAEVTRWPSAAVPAQTQDLIRVTHAARLERDRRSD